MADRPVAGMDESDGNYSIVFDFLFRKYYQFFVDLNATDAVVNGRASENRALLHSPDDGLPFGIKAVIILIAVLSALWLGCVLYLLSMACKKQRNEPKTTSADRYRSKRPGFLIDRFRQRRPPIIVNLFNKFTK